MKKSFFISLILSVLLFSICFVGCQSNTTAILKDMYAGYYSIAEEYFSMKKYDKAAIYYEKCLSDKDGEIRRSVQYKLAKTYVQLDKFLEAKKIYEELLSFDENNQNLKSSIAFCYLKLNQFDKAEEIYNDMLKNQNYDTNNYKNLILLKLMQNNFEEAEKLIADYKEKFPLDESISTLENTLQEAKTASEKDENAEKDEDEDESEDESVLSENEESKSDGEN